MILDEPLSGFDPINAQRIREVILELKAKGDTTILLSTHDMGSVEEMCDEVALLNRGQLVLNGKVPELREAARDGRYAVTFRDTVMAFTVALGASAELIEVNPNPEVPGEHLAMLRLPAESDIATGAVDIGTGGAHVLHALAPGNAGHFIRAVEHQKQPWHEQTRTHHLPGVDHARAPSGVHHRYAHGAGFAWAGSGPWGVAGKCRDGGKQSLSR